MIGTDFFNHLVTLLLPQTHRLWWFSSLHSGKCLLVHPAKYLSPRPALANQRSCFNCTSE